MSGSVSLSPTQQSFVSQYLPLAQSVATQTGLSPYTVLGQAALETGWGQSVSGNNFFGISPGGSLATYSTPAQGFNAYAGLINSRYSGAAAYSDPADQALAIANAGYGPAGGAAQYGASVSAVVSELQAAIPGLSTSTAPGAIAGNLTVTPQGTVAPAAASTTIPGVASGQPATVLPGTSAAPATASLGFYALAIVLIVGLVLFGLYGLTKEA